MLFEQFLVALSLLYVVSAQGRVPICSAGSIDIQPLLKVVYWRVDIVATKCSDFFNTSCIVYMSVCQPLPDNITGCDIAKLGPTSICITNGKVGYSLGAYDPTSNPFFDFRENGSAIAGYSNGSNTSKCNAIQTTVEYDCRVHGNWTSLSKDNGDASARLLQFHVTLGRLCQTYINFGFDSVCRPVECAAGLLDITDLTGPDYWTIKLAPEQCLPFFGKSSAGCNLYISFCKSLNGITQCDNFINSSVCVANATNGISLGRYWSAINPFSTSSNSIQVSYGDGSNYQYCPSTSGTTTTFMQLDCAYGSRWTHSGSTGDATKFLLSFADNPVDGCLIISQFKYDGVCFPRSNAGGSVGWVGLGLLFALAVVVAAYLIGGSVFNIYRGHNTCPDMLPNYGFWRSFFVYVIEGVNWSVDICTCGYCGERSGSKRQYEQL